MNRIQPNQASQTIQVMLQKKKFDAKKLFRMFFLFATNKNLHEEQKLEENSNQALNNKTKATNFFKNNFYQN
ncbi:hypothetical protein BpHYR1_025282 [Brachionus plicatilis]|uniref:Uncharacterized protein n=1 Tax=Brachionus plicatilis TaxID=10195 RepID=A0A3M7R3X8_BRAPC|nr:hypothetical protein BpHYR1_025282 [Brachionus plicatilis]